jgi:hypothetical protein
MPIEDDDDIDDNDLDDPADDDDLEPDTSASARARQIAADQEARQAAARYATPDDPGMTEAEWHDANQGLLDLAAQDLASDDPETVRRGNATMQRFEGIKRQIAKHRPGRIA